MSDYMARRGVKGRSPFDDIMHVEDDGNQRIEWWSARELSRALSYTDWRNFENAIRRAKVNCQKAGNDPADHFVGATENLYDAGRPSADVQMTRYGCYLVALNADPNKAEVAAAKRYFAVMTRAAELDVSPEVAARAVPTAPPAPVIDRPWSVRFRESMQPHNLHVNVHHPKCFTVVTASIKEMLMFEDELIRHLFNPEPSDRPDISIGRRWSDHRRTLGLPIVTRTAPLRLPDQDRDVQVWVYTRDERGAFEDWLNDVYLVKDLADYLGNKKEFKVFGVLPPASVADNACRKLTGQPAILKPRVRTMLNAVKGFAPIGTMPPELVAARAAKEIALPMPPMFDMFH